MEEALDKLWFKIKNMHGYELEWEWMTGAKNGEYLMREEVLSLIDALKIANTPADNTEIPNNLFW